MMCFGQAVRVRDIMEGISRIDSVDFAYAHRLNHTLRLIAGGPGVPRASRGPRLEDSPP